MCRQMTHQTSRAPRCLGFITLGLVSISTHQTRLSVTTRSKLVGQTRELAGLRQSSQAHQSIVSTILMLTVAITTTQPTRKNATMFRQLAGPTKESAGILLMKQKRIACRSIVNIIHLLTLALTITPKVKTKMTTSLKTFGEQKAFLGMVTQR